MIATMQMYEFRVYLPMFGQNKQTYKPPNILVIMMSCANYSCKMIDL